MKIKTLMAALAAVLCAGTAMAQSDPSVGGSFGNHFSRGAVSSETSTSVNVGNPQRYLPITSRSQAPARTTFWGRLTGRNVSGAHPAADRADRRQGWFDRSGSADAHGRLNLRRQSHLQGHGRDRERRE